MIKFVIKNNKGFTLLEALVAISILMVAISAPITIAQKGLSSAIYTKSQMIASYLAQDAIEYIKNRRDVVTINSLDSGSHSYDWADLWDGANLLPCVVTDFVAGPGCQIDTNDQGVGKVEAYSDTKTLSITDGFYGYGAGTATNFIRRIQIVRDPTTGNPNEAMVKVTVKWGDNSEKSVVVYTLIYNY